MERDGDHIFRYVTKNSPLIMIVNQSRILRKLLITSDGHWEWLGYCTPGGYPRIMVNGKCIYLHRLAYEELVGPIPEGWHVDHLCKNTRCFYPGHLTIKQPSENVRGKAKEGHPPYS